MTEIRPNARTTAARLARIHRATALDVGHAVLVGNLAGVVEWTHEAWSQLTGFPLEETLDKPITHFLDRAGLEVELVDFVAQQFLAGRASTVEMPFETFDGRSIHVRLEVEPLRDENAEIERFIAVARQIDAPEEREPAGAASSSAHAQGEPETRRRKKTASSAASPIRVGDVVARALAAHVERARNARLDVAFEALLEPALPRVRANARDLEHLLDQLVAAALSEADRQPVFVTVLAGSLRPGRSHLSKAHPIPLRSVARDSEPGIYLEVHDTGPHLDAEALRRIRRTETPRTPRESALIGAALEAQELGLAFHLDSTPGCGTQALVRLPPAQA